MDANTFGLMSAGFANALMPSNLIMMIIGVTIGIVVGCMPGLSAAMGVALLLPLTFGMAPETGLIMLGGIYCGAIFGGSISAILIHTPGTPASAATALDGYELTKQGKAGKALGTACIASFFGGLLSCISLYFFAPMLAELAMKFGSPEYFWLALFGLTIIAGVTTGSMVKGLMSGAFGLILSTIGMDPMEGTERFMFGIDELYNGINVTCALIGLFSMSQALILAEKKKKHRDVTMEQFYRGSVAALKSMYLLPMAIPAASVVVLWKILFDSHGFVNSAIHALSGMSGIGQILNVLSVQEVDWMNTDAAFGILVFSYVWKYLGYDIVLWMAGLSAIPQGIYEAAEVDGAGKWKKFFYITLPNLRPVAFTVVILSVLNSFKAFREVYMAAGSYPQENIYLLQHVFNNWFQTLSVDKMAAASVMLAFVIAVFVLLLERSWEREG